MSRAVVASDGVVRVTVRKPTDASVTASDVQDPDKLARMVQDIRGLLAAQDAPIRSIDFEDWTVATSGALIRLPHGFGKRVRWWLVDWSSTGTSAPVLKRDASSDDNVLILASYVAGTVTVRVEEAA